MKHLQNKKALLTGAASGIGLALSQALAAQGVDLWLVDIDQAGLELAANMARQHNVEVVTDSCDLAEPSQIDALVERIKSEWGALHILINNAAVGFYGSIWVMTQEQWDHLLNVNLHAPIQLIRLLLPTLVVQDDAHIVNISSILGLSTYRKATAYQTSKYAMVGLSESLRMEYAGTNLAVSVICPGFVQGTQFYASMIKPDPQHAKRKVPDWLCCTPQTVASKTITAIRRNRGLTVVTRVPPLLWWLKRLSPWAADRFYQWGYGWSRRRREKRKVKRSSESDV